MKAAKKQATREKQIIISIIADLSSLAGLQEIFFIEGDKSPYYPLHKTEESNREKRD